MKSILTGILSFLIFFAAVPTVQASDMNNMAGMEEVKKRKKARRRRLVRKERKRKKVSFLNLLGVNNHGFFKETPR